MPTQTLTIPIARNGLNKDLEASDLAGNYSPNMKNVVVEPSKVRKHLGYSAMGLNLPLQGIGMELIQYTDARATTHNIALTTTMAYEYSSDDDQWLPKMPDVQIQDCEAHGEWNAGSDITVSTDNTNYKEGSNSLKMLAGDDVAVGAKIADSTTFDDTDDISDYGAIANVSFWFRASKANVQITVHIKDADTDIEVLSFTAVTALKWYRVTKQVDLSGIDTATSIEIDTETALVDTDYINIDDIRVCGSFTGGANNRWSWGLATDVNAFASNSGLVLIISNDVDDLYFYQGHSGDTFKDSTAGVGVSTVGFDFPSFGSVKEIIEFWNHFFYINWTDADQNAKSLAYTDLGNINEWEDGTSGSNALTDSVGELLRAKKLGSDLILYSGKTITTGRYLGAGILFVFPTLVYEAGLYAEKAIWDFVNMHYFLSSDLKIYGYPGGRQLISIGDAIEDSLFAEFDASKKAKIVAGLDPVRHKLYFFGPLAGDDYAKTYYAWNYKSLRKSWEYGRFTHDVRDFSIFDNSRDWYCDDEDLKNLYCDEVDFYCDSSYSQLGNAVSIFISSTGYVYRLDELGSHASSDIEMVYDTEEISLDDQYSYCRWSFFSFMSKANIVDSTIKVYYSISDGNDWSDWTEMFDSPVSLTSVWTTYRYAIQDSDGEDILAKKIRFRFYQKSQKDFQVRNPMHVECDIDTPQD